MRLFLLIVAVISIFGASPGFAAVKPSEQQLKAAYLYNFAKFITWPDTAFSDAEAPMVIGVLGKNPFNGELHQLTARNVRKRPIEIRYFKSLNELKDCQLLYIASEDEGELKSILKSLSTKPLVTVGEGKKFADSGGIIQFVTKRDRLKFIINLDVAKANGIKIEAQLLSLAVEILETGK